MYQIAVQLVWNVNFSVVSFGSFHRVVVGLIYFIEPRFGRDVAPS